MGLFRREGFDKLIGRRLAVHLSEDDRSLRGVLVANHIDSLSLCDVEYLAEAKADPLGGESAGVLKSNISFWQVL